VLRGSNNFSGGALAWFRNRGRRARCREHWSPGQAREFLTLMEGDRTYAVWAFLLGSGLRIGELVCLHWPNVDLPRRRVFLLTEIRQ